MFPKEWYDRLPCRALDPDRDLWMECATDAAQLAYQVGNTGVIDREGLLAIDWLFFSNDEAPGSFAHACALVGWNADWARNRLLRDNRLARAFEMVSALYGVKAPQKSILLHQQDLFAA